MNYYHETFHRDSLSVRDILLCMIDKMNPFPMNGSEMNPSSSAAGTDVNLPLHLKSYPNYYILKTILYFVFL